MEVTGWYVLPRLFFFLANDKKISTSSYEKALSTGHSITKGSHTKETGLSYQPTKAYPRTVPGAHKDFQSIYTGHTHTYSTKQPKGISPVTFRKCFKMKSKNSLKSLGILG